jgi:type I restriction enzyme M protein
MTPPCGTGGMLLAAVIGLAPNLFYGTGLAACILILRRRKDPRRAGQVLIVDASSLFRKGRAQNFLDPEHAATILGWVQAFADVPDRARVVSVEEIKAEDWTLNISRYVLPPLGEDIPPLPQAIADFKAALVRVREAEDKLRELMMAGDGWRSSPTDPPPGPLPKREGEFIDFDSVCSKLLALKVTPCATFHKVG